MTSVRRALALSMAERYVLIAIALASNMVLARLLTPEEIGIYSVNLAIIGIAQVLRDFGIGNFLIQEKNLSEAHIRTAFGFSLVIGSALFCLVYGAAPLAGDFYDEGRLAATLRISALNFLVLPFCTISLALLRREMAFNRMVTVTLAAAIAGFVATIGLVYSGQGVNGIALGAVIGNLATGAGAWLARGERRLLLPALSEWRTMLSFGSQSSAANMAIAIAMDINDFALGKILGFSSVAMISRAQGLMKLFSRDLTAAIQNVAFPAFAKAHREGEAIESRHIASVAAITAFAWPFYGFVSLYALEIIRLMFGPQWDEAASLVPIFCLAGALMAVSSLNLTVLLAVGRFELVTRFELVFQPFRALLIVAAALVFKSLGACAIAYLVCILVYTPGVYALKQKCIPNDYRGLRSNLWVSCKVALATLALPAALAIQAGLDRSMPADPALLAGAAVLAAIGWVAALIACGHPLTAEPLFIKLAGKLPFPARWKEKITQPFDRSAHG